MSLPTSNFLEPSDWRLAHLINQDNARQIRYGVDYTFGLPKDYSDQDGRNTQVPLIANPHSNYANDTVYYRRLPIDVLNSAPLGQKHPVRVEHDDQVDAHQLLDRINESYSIHLLANEVDPKLIKESDHWYLLTILCTSLAWLPGTLRFKVHLAKNDIPLGALIRTTQLMDLRFN